MKNGIHSFCNSKYIKDLKWSPLLRFRYKLKKYWISIVITKYTNIYLDLVRYIKRIFIFITLIKELLILV